MEDIMAALTDRQKARERLGHLFQSLLDKMVPADESVPLKGRKFIDWEEMGDEMARELVPAFLEERSALEPSARVEEGGRCPHCGSGRVYLMKESSQVEVITPHGNVVMRKQRCRCRACDRTFSPSGAGLELADGSGVVAESQSASGAGDGGSVVRQRGAGDQH
jgi:hypothetical protein